LGGPPLCRFRVRYLAWHTRVRGSGAYRGCVLSLVVAAGAAVDVYRIGDSGAKAAWHDGFSKTASGGDGDDN
jgi:hypothetical protein